MATRAATFTSKIRNLKDYHYRVLNNMTPQPTGVDIANTVKYFSQTLLSVLKDVPNIPLESYGPRQRDSVRLSVFPNLNYSGLYRSVLETIDLVPVVQLGQLALGEAVLNVLGCLVPFLEHDLLDALPYTVAALLAVFPAALHRDAIDLLCTNLLPMTLGFDGCTEPTYTSESTAAIITMVFQQTENSVFHSQILECLMSMKKDLIKDLLSVIAYGPPAAKAPAANLLFYYWPQLNPALSDRRGIHYKYLEFEFTAWTPVLCQREGCINSGNCQAVKMCLNPALAIHSGDKPPPLYICNDCADTLRRDNTDYMVDILLPMTHVSSVCENKNCRSKNSLAVCTCFSKECASFNGNRPIRYCQNCHDARHTNRSSQQHVYHLSDLNIWTCAPDLQRYLIDAIVSLLKEAQPIEAKRMVEMGEEHRHRSLEDEEFFEVEDSVERKLLSRYGIWLLVELCRPKEDIPIEVLGRLLSMLFQWFDATAYLPDDNIGNALERLKPEYVCSWLQDVAKTHFEVIVSCLLPHPVDYARVGGFWDTLSTRTNQIKEGLNCFFCLVPYDIITFEIWDYVMPYWLESIRTEVPSEDLQELKVLLSKAFDIDMCPLPFTLAKMYNFISERFEDNSAYVQEQALQWLQILSSLDIIIPIHLLSKIFQSGVKSLHSDDASDSSKVEGHGHSLLSPSSPVDEFSVPLSPEKTQAAPEHVEMFDRETELILPCFIMMVDLITKQIELQETPKHLGIYNVSCKELMQLLSLMLSNPWDGTHTCNDEHLSVNCGFCQNIALWHQFTAQVMEHMSPRDPVKIPAKDLPKPDELHKLNAAKINKEVRENKSEEKVPEPQFDIASMPEHLQLFHALLKDLCTVTDVDALFSLLTSLKYLVLHGESLNYTVHQYFVFINHSLKKYFIPNLWKLLQAEHSHLSTMCVPLLLHCMTLPRGADILWQLVEDDFTNEDWRARFSACEKVTVIGRRIDSEAIRNNQVIQTSLAHAFCLLIGSLEDVNAAIAQRVQIYLETIKPTAIKCLCQCLEFQFDTVINDRTMILHRIFLLSNVLPEQFILSWEFFLNRFDTLSLEAQLDLESAGDIAFPTDLTSSDRESDTFLRKLNRARFALAKTDSIRSVRESVHGKPPYRRTSSVPLHLVNRTQVKGDSDKPYLRQQSAPQFGRRNTKGNLGGFGGFMFQGGHLREFTDEESNFAALLQRAMDLEGVDRETVYQLVALLMKFMSQSSQDDVNADRFASKAQNIVLRHLNVLLGYNQTEKSFSVPPYKLRSSTVFNAFLSGLPFLLDKNFKLGSIILPISLLLLQYSPSPQRYASDFQPTNYTLWFLEPHTRVSWLSSLLVILYKYPVNTAPVSTIIQTLMKIVINMIDAQHHRCKKSDDYPPSSPAAPRNRDASKISASDLENIQETDTPPQSPVNPTRRARGGSLHIDLTLTPSTSIIQYARRQFENDVLTEEGSSDADSTPTHVPKKDSPKKHKEIQHRKARRLVEYPVSAAAKGQLTEDVMSEIQESPDEEEEADCSSTTMPILSPDAPLVAQTMMTLPPDALLVAQTMTTLSPDAPLIAQTSPPTVEKKMAQQIQEFESENEARKSVQHDHDASNVVDVATGKTASADGSTVCEPIKEPVSEVESTEDSEKTQTTSDAESEKHNAASDSGDATQEEYKEDAANATQNQATKPNFRQRKARKTGLMTVELQNIFPELEANTAAGDIPTKPVSRRSRRSELLVSKTQAAAKKPAVSRSNETIVVERCPECNTVLEQYDDETIGLCIVVLATFIHREPSLATPLLLDMLQCVGRIAATSPYAWQLDCNLVLPGNSVSVARQFLRCCLHQLAPNGIFPMIFQSHLNDHDFMKTMANALVDFNELTCHAPLQFLLEGLNSKKNLPAENIMLLLRNLATYMNCIGLETSSPMWSSILLQFDIFFRRLPSVLPSPCDMTSIFKIMLSVLKVPGIVNVRGILEPFSRIMSCAIENCTFKLQQALDLCSLCNRVMTKERDKLYLTRVVIFELVQALKFKSCLPDENLLMLVQFVVLDSGGTISTNIIGDIGMLYKFHSQTLLSTCAAECMRQNLADCLEFISDLHTLTKVKGNMKGGNTNLNEDTLGSQMKSGIAQFIALEITKGNGRDNRAISRYMPWLYHPPSSLQQGPKEFIDCVGHIRLLSWLLIGSLTHTAVTEGAAPVVCLPIPLEASTHVAEHVLVIMTGFAEQSKASVLHMSSLFHAFILCQLWTMYCESAASQHSFSSEQHQAASMTVMDFWARVTPGILQLLSHTKVLAEMVNLHFLGLIEALQECNSSVLSKLFPMWTAVLFAYHSRLPAHLHVRLQNCQNWGPPTQSKEQSFNCQILLTWLKRVQFKLGQIEVQSSAATQFYTV